MGFWGSGVRGLGFRVPGFRGLGFPACALNRALMALVPKTKCKLPKPRKPQEDGNQVCLEVLGLGFMGL